MRSEDVQNKVNRSEELECAIHKETKKKGKPRTYNEKGKI